MRRAARALAAFGPRSAHAKLARSDRVADKFPDGIERPG